MSTPPPYQPSYDSDEADAIADAANGAAEMFACPDCDKTFTRAASLGAHRANAHDYRRNPKQPPPPARGRSGPARRRRAPPTRCASSSASSTGATSSTRSCTSSSRRSPSSSGGSLRSGDERRRLGSDRLPARDRERARARSARPVSGAALYSRIDVALDALLDVERAAGDEIDDLSWLDSARGSLLAFRDQLERRDREQLLAELERMLEDVDEAAT